MNIQPQSGCVISLSSQKSRNRVAVGLQPFPAELRFAVRILKLAVGRFFTNRQ